MSFNEKKIAIALSGGVDSAVAAKILKDEGYKLVGFFLKLWSDPTCQVTGENRCCNYEALEDARAVAAKLDIPFYVIDAKEEFKKQVVDYFIEEYKNLRTPNPCIICNQKIKFDLLLNKALEIGCDYLATGHYARITKTEEQNNRETEEQLTSHSELACLPNWRDSESIRMSFSDAHKKNDKKKGENDIKKLKAVVSWKLKAGIDPIKDQSYNLYRLSQEQLSKIIFPLGEMTKKETRELAKKWDLPVKEKAESQEICFFGDKDYRNFLKRYLPAKYFLAGDIVDTGGYIIGRHEGLINYTIGQRKNINQTAKVKDKNGNSKSKSKRPLYVVGFNTEQNQLIVGEDCNTYRREMTISDIHWISNFTDCSLLAADLKVKIRSQAKAVACTIQLNSRCTEKQISKNSKTIHENLLVVFSERQRAITPGQSAVFYSGDEVIGGGIIL